MARISEAAMKNNDERRRVPAAMQTAWQAVGAARAKAFPAACRAPHDRKRVGGTGWNDNAEHARADKRTRAAAVSMDAPLIPDSSAEVLATGEGKVLKLLKASSVAKKGSLAAILTKENVAKDKVSGEEQRQMVPVPVDGTVSAQHVKEGQPVKAGELLLTIDVSGLSQYLSLLNRTPAVRAAVDRTVTPDDSASAMGRPTRFTMAVAVQGVLTARLAMRVVGGPVSGEGRNRAVAGGAVAGAAGAGSGDAMVIDGEALRGGSNPEGMVIESVSISGVTEVVLPWESSAMAVFRAINREALSTLERLRARRARQVVHVK